MKQEDFQVVAELYRFLATFDAASIEAASRLPGISDNLRTALIALHKETALRRHNVRPLPGRASNSSSKPTGGRSLDPLTLLLDKQRFPAKQNLMELAKSLQLEVNVDSKTSRERLARRIARIAEEDPAVCERLYDLVSAAKDSQTAGWVDVIRGD